MENWGLVTYRTTAVLFDEANSDAKYKNRVAYVVAHGTLFEMLPSDAVSINLTPYRTCSSMVWEPGHHGLVERVVAQRGVCYLGRLVSYRSSLSR